MTGPAQDKYDDMMALADEFDATGSALRTQSALGAAILRDEAVAPSATLSPRTYAAFEAELRAATTGKTGLQTRAVELDADALVVRATVLTYRWIDELQEAAYRTLGTLASWAIGYLAPQVELGGAIVSAGLIETDALDRDDVAAYLSELAEHNPDLMDHLTSGGGGLLESLQMRALLTTDALAGDAGAAAARGGLLAVGVDRFPTDLSACLRDAAAGLVAHDAPAGSAVPGASDAAAPASLAELITQLEQAHASVTIQPLGGSRYLVFLPGPYVGIGRLRLVAGDHTAYASDVLTALRGLAEGDPDVVVALVGSAQGGVAAAHVAATSRDEPFRVAHLVTAGAPAAHVPRIAAPTQVLSLEDRSDPVALLGSLVTAGDPNRTTVIVDGTATGVSRYVAGARAADLSGHPALRAAIARLRSDGFLAT